MNKESQQILRLEGLGVSYGGAQAVRDISFAVEAGEIFGLVGESGSGKSTVLRACVGLLGGRGTVCDGSIVYLGRDITHARPKELAKLRGAEMSYVFQDSTASLDPLYTIKKQFDECIRAHRSMDAASMEELEEGLLRDMGFDDPTRVLAARPDQLSGGMCQRVVLAFCLACEPKLILADEPTSALDIAVQAQVLEAIAKIRRERGVAVIIVSHNIGVIASLADRVGVMYNGEMVEIGTTDEVLHNPQHPYTRDLIAAIPKTDGSMPTVPERNWHER